MLTTVAEYSGRRVVWLYAAGWLLFCLAQGLVLHRLGFLWEQAFLDAVVFTVVTALCGAVSALVFRFYQPGPGGWMYRVAFAVGMAAAACFIFQGILSRILSHVPHYLFALEQSMPVRFLLALLLLSFHIVLMWVLSVLDDHAETERRKNQAEMLARDAELISLRQQLQPHFLFNSLNSISALAGADPAGARSMIQQVSDFLRGTIRKDDTLVPVKEELGHLLLYLEIEKVRFGHRLNVVMDIAAECEVMKVPPMLFQPVVENAIKHGLYGITGPVTITITATCTNNLLLITVRNPCDEIAGISSGTGTGLRIVSRRLHLIYGRNDLLSTQRNQSVFQTEIRIPQ